MIDYLRGVQLGRIEVGDLPALRSWRNDIRIRKFCRQQDLISPDDHRAWFDGLAGDSTRTMFLIHGPQSPIGVCGLTSIDYMHRRAEFSLYIAPGHQNSGFGKKALQTLLDHAFKGLGLNVVWGETFEGNQAALMFEKLGMTKEGTRRQFYFKNGKMIDAHLYSITAGEWK